MPFLNTEPYLADAIASVANQTFQAWELILVDDGSTDGSTRIAREHASADPERIVYLEHPGHVNLGTSASRNLALSVARGELIMMLDGDDVWLPGTLRRAVSLIDEHPTVGMVMAPALWWYSWTGEPGVRDRVDFAEGRGVRASRLYAPPDMLVNFLRRPTSIPSVSSVVLRSEAVTAVGGFEEEFRGAYDDHVLFTKIVLKNPVYVDDRWWVRYRRHPDSLTSSSRWMADDERVARQVYLDWLRRYLIKQRIFQPRVWAALRQAQLLQRPPQQIARWLGLDWKVRGRSMAGRMYLRLPPHLRSVARAVRYRERYAPPPGRARFGSLRRTSPLSRRFGYDRGTPIDRFYIERFLASQAELIRGRVLEVGDNTYTKQFGGQRVSHSDILHVDASNLRATYVDDLAIGSALPSNAFDCVVLTETLQFVYDFHGAVKTLYRILAPGGVALVTAPGIRPLAHNEWEDSWYWSFNVQSMRRMFADVFGVDHIKVVSYGNVLSSAAFLYGLAAEELRREELEVRDSAYDVAVCVVATKPQPTPVDA